MPEADGGREQPRPRAQPAEFDRRLLAPMILGAILNPVNSSIIAVSLVPIGAALGAPPSGTAWLVSGLYLATAIGQPVVGQLVDTYGPRAPFLVGSALVSAAGVLGSVAPNLPVLALARVLLGFGTCAGYPAAMSLIRGEARRTGQDSPAGVLTVLAVCTQTIAVIGPPLGGLLIGLAGWRATLAVNIPLGVAAFLLGAARLARAGGGDQPRRRARLDYLGMALFATALVALLLFLMKPGLARWYLLAVSAVAAPALVYWQARAPVPFLDLRLLAGNLPLLLSYGRALLAYLVSYAFLYGYTQWLEDGRGLPPTTAGLLQLPLFATAILVSITTGRRNDFRRKLVVAAAGQLVACVLLCFLGRTSPLGVLVLVALVFGIPQGLNGLALQNCVYYQSEPAHTGASAGLLRTFSYLGAILSSATQGTFFGRSAGTDGLHHLAVFMLVVSALFLLVTLPDRSLRPGRLLRTERSEYS